VGQVDGIPYLVSEFVAGMTLADWLTAQRPTPREAAQLVATLADTLQYAHDQGVVHRDVEYLGGQWHEELIDGVQFFFPASDGNKLGVVEVRGSGCVMSTAVRGRLEVNSRTLKALHAPAVGCA
jgi:hypothetical protein